MQTEAPHSDMDSLLSSEKKTTRSWTTIQLIYIVLIAASLTALITNMDRIVEEIENSSKSNSKSKPSSFGHDMLQEFSLAHDYREFNFGAYGNAPQYVIDYDNAKRLEIESCPTAWFRTTRVPTLDHVLQMLAQYLNIQDWHDLAFIINASHGMNAVLRSITKHLYTDRCSNNMTSCKILQFNTAYGNVKNLIEYVNDDPASKSNQLIEFQVTTPMLSNTSLLLQHLEAFIIDNLENQNTTIYMASISHIASVPSVLYDVKSIQTLFRKYGIITLMDAAHVMGAIHVNITDLDPDIWLSNGHKWLYSTRGSAVIYVKKEYQHLIFPTVISAYPATLQTLFNYQGTMNDAIWWSMLGALEFREQYGENDIIDYIHDICMEGGELLTNMWDTGLLINNEENIGSMINPILPTKNITEIDMIKNVIENGIGDDFYSLTTISTFEGITYMRLSCQIYHEISDFEWLGNRVLSIIQDIRN